MTPQMLLSKIRDLGRMSQNEVALSAGVNQPMLSKLERGITVDIMSKSYVALMGLYLKLQEADKERAEFLAFVRAKKRKADKKKQFTSAITQARP